MRAKKMTLEVNLRPGETAGSFRNALAGWLADLRSDQMEKGYVVPVLRRTSTVDMAAPVPGYEVVGKASFK